jgi:serine/threonine protein kinase/tetratricopeptide (TPR) repeat protein
MTLTATTRLGPYEILSKLGAGGMGEVYRARDTRLDREVAIKVLPEEYTHDAVALARFQREVKAVAMLSHPHILTLFEFDTEQGRPYAVMELLQGQTLGSRLKQGPLDWRTAMAIATAIAEGLAAAHAKGIVHRDIKPENIFLTADGGLKILDFGLVRLEHRLTAPGNAATVTLETEQGVVLGTICYMAPEQVRGQPADARTDVFSFGCLLYEMLTGRRPFDGETGADTMAAILNSPPAPLGPAGELRPPDLDQLVLRCLEKKPAQRFTSGADLAAALRAISRDAALTDSGHQRKLDTAVGQENTGVYVAQRSGPSIAVLPFVNMSSDPENEFFSDGLAEELITVLTKVKGLHVISRTSAFAFKGKNEDVRKIGEQLNVRTVLEGSVRKAGNRLRIAAQLVNAADGYHLWSETYNRTMEDVFAIQDEIAQNIAKALQLILTEQDRKAMENVRQRPEDVAAYEFYLRGRQFFHQFRRRGFEFAEQMFRQAIAIDPNYARAYAGIADCHSFLYLNWAATPANLAKADEASRKALELGPDLAEAHVARGFALSLHKQFTEARQDFEKAIQLDPKLFEARYFYGRACMREGKPLEAARLFEQACELRPDDYQSLMHLATICNGQGRFEEARAMARRCLQVIEKHLALHPDDPRALYLGAVGWSKLNEPARALEWAGRAAAMDPEEPLILYNVACVHALLGKVDEALGYLEAAVKHGYAHKEWMRQDSDLRALHGQPRYEALVA